MILIETAFPTTLITSKRAETSCYIFLKSRLGDYTLQLNQGKILLWLDIGTFTVMTQPTDLLLLIKLTNLQNIWAKQRVCTHPDIWGK